jgi:uncharacterized protein YndB with AHSA1/START domain
MGHPPLFRDAIAAAQFALMATRQRGYMESCSIAAAPQDVWGALVDPALLARWLAKTAAVEPRPGGLYRFEHAHAGRREAHIDVFEPPRRLRLIHFAQPDWPVATDVTPVDDVMIVQRDEVTVVRIMGSGIPLEPAWDPLLRRWRGTWAVGLAQLKKMLEARTGATGTGPA